LSIDKATLLGEVESAYRGVRGGLRTLHLDDLLEEQLEIDSLMAVEILVTLESRRGVELVGDARTTQLRTVGDLVELLADLCDERNATRDGASDWSD
jgi:acyl carrier protein